MSDPRSSFIRIIALAAGSLMAFFYAAAADKDTPKPTAPIEVATTARLVKMDVRRGTLTVRIADNRLKSPQAAELTPERDTQRLKVSISAGHGRGVRLPGSFPIQFPDNDKNANKKTARSDEYLVTVTDATVLRDLDRSIALEDFKIGDHLSIHGVLRGTTISATQISKWPA